MGCFKCIIIKYIPISNQLTLWDVSNVISMEYLFAYTESFIGIGLEYWNVSQTQIMTRMFSGTKNIFDIDLSKWDVSNVEIIVYVLYV